MSFSEVRVLQVARSDEPDSFVLLHVFHTGPATLDLTLTATEGESPYITTIKQTQLQDLCAKNYQGSQDEWAQTVSFVLGQSILSDQPPWWSEIESSASVSTSNEGSKEIVLTIRKRVQDITQRLGALTLLQDDEQAIELFEWCGVTARKTSDLQNQVTSLMGRYRSAEDTISKLNQQLEELRRAKSQHESQMLVNFLHLLNEKKLKIRNQQRLLASATADPVKVSEIQAATGRIHDPTGTSQAPKRRLDDTNDAAEESDDGFEPMDTDHRGLAGGSLSDQETDDEMRSTPQPLEEEDNMTTDDEPDAPATLGRAVPQPQEADNLTRPPPSKERTPPPRRELPFARRGPPRRDTIQTEAASAGIAEETAGETDDDEL
ncbi:hypothetical protein N7462_000263 [Penicillium macrosclerotiorum]|uniref:uncharacterized protein n=1 Tax=Penicillium macrosclerotiorum TaxID=303699 RepID=UPI002547DFB5|nr:uncharacterized protein N7462_000263 [Penicillium macrosclerotiorum]KAJ5698258.1 hypothetical protein N7462_000263 [Penicillium macrosclerotiorum]